MKTHSPFSQHFVEDTVFLLGIDGASRGTHGDDGPRHFQTDEMRTQENDGASLYFIERNGGFYLNEFFDPLDGRPPEYAAFEYAAPVSLKVLQRNPATFLFGHVGKTQAKIGQRDVTSSFHQVIGCCAQSFAKAAENGQWQPVQQPEDEQKESHRFLLLHAIFQQTGVCRYGECASFVMVRFQSMHQTVICRDGAMPDVFGRFVRHRHGCRINAAF